MYNCRSVEPSDSVTRHGGTPRPARNVPSLRAIVLVRARTYNSTSTTRDRTSTPQSSEISHGQSTEGD